MFFLRCPISGEFAYKPSEYLFPAQNCYNYFAAALAAAENKHMRFPFGPTALAISSSDG